MSDSGAFALGIAALAVGTVFYLWLWGEEIEEESEIAADLKLPPNERRFIPPNTQRDIHFYDDFRGKTAVNTAGDALKLVRSDDPNHETWRDVEAWFEYPSLCDVFLQQAQAQQGTWTANWGSSGVFGGQPPTQSFLTTWTASDGSSFVLNFIWQVKSRKAYYPNSPWDVRDNSGNPRYNGNMKAIYKANMLLDWGRADELAPPGVPSSISSPWNACIDPSTGSLSVFFMGWWMLYVGFN
jgi:hypothetical protein